jgi:hypothetical protein
MSAEARKKILEEAIVITSNDRNLDYGDPEDNFRMIAELWSVYLQGMEIRPHDVAVMMILMKAARVSTSPSKPDHWVDMAGYAGCGGGLFPS